VLLTNRPRADSALYCRVVGCGQKFETRTRVRTRAKPVTDAEAREHFANGTEKKMNKVQLQIILRRRGVGVYLLKQDLLDKLRDSFDNAPLV
jgi:hypothetical protein